MNSISTQTETDPCFEISAGVANCCLNHASEIEQLILEHQKSTQILLKNKYEEFSFLSQENKRLEESERMLLNEIRLLKATDQNEHTVTDTIDPIDANEQDEIIWMANDVETKKKQDLNDSIIILSDSEELNRNKMVTLNE